MWEGEAQTHNEEDMKGLMVNKDWKEGGDFLEI